MQILKSSRRSKQKTHIQMQRELFQDELRIRLLERRASGDPLLAEPTLLAYPEEQQDRTHYQPQQALLALVDILRVQAAATDAAELAGVNPGRMACLLNVIAEQMTVNFSTVESALVLREMLANSDAKVNHAR